MPDVAFGLTENRSMTAGNSPLIDSLAALQFAKGTPGLAGELFWHIGTGLMSGGEAVAIIIDHYRRTYPNAFER